VLLIGLKWAESARKSAKQAEIGVADLWQILSIAVTDAEPRCGCVLRRALSLIAGETGRQR